MLNKDAYLSSQVVKGFIAYVQRYIQGESFPHSYVIRRGNHEWSCGSFADAAKNYYWPIHKDFRNKDCTDYCSYDANRNVLTRLRRELRDAYLGKNEAELLKSSCKIFKWGGVTNGNAAWIQKYYSGGNSLTDFFKRAKQALTTNNPDLSSFGRSKNLGDLRMNAGFTKIYSLLFDNFIIYDSRVAATLNLFVLEFLKENDKYGEHENLVFGCLPANEGKQVKKPKIRVPSSGNYKFKMISGNERFHAESNIKANWIIEAATRDIAFGSFPAATKMRAFEAACFMIGYDLAGHPWLTCNS